MSDMGDPVLPVEPIPPPPPADDMAVINAERAAEASAKRKQQNDLRARRIENEAQKRAREQADAVRLAAWESAKKNKGTK